MKKKKIFILLLVCLFVISYIDVFAIEDTNCIDVQVQEYSKFKNCDWTPIAEYSIIDVPSNATEEEKIATIDSYLKNNVELNSVEIALYTLVIRSGNSTDCELYFRWTGSHIISMISFSNLKIQSTSWLNPTIYSNIGGSTIYCSPAAVAGTAKILDISVPTNVSTVRAVITSPKMCSLSAGWLSLASTNFKVTIN